MIKFLLLLAACVECAQAFVAPALRGAPPLRPSGLPVSAVTRFRPATRQQNSFYRMKVHHFFSASAGSSDPSGSSAAAGKGGYYETISGVKYDRGVLDAARAATSGAGDGRISKKDAEAIFEKIVDGNKISEIEYRTAFLLLRDYKFTDEGRAVFIDKLAPGDLPEAGPSEAKGSYYETGVDGIKYDKGMLDVTRASVAGVGDGRVSKKDAESVLAKILDGNTITEVEYRTAFLLLRHFKFTDEGRAVFVDKLATA